MTDENRFERVAAVLKTTPDVLLALEQKHGTIGVLTSEDTSSWACVLRKPTRKEYAAYKANASNPNKAADCQEHLLKSTLIIPSDYDAIERLLDEWPGIPEAFANSGLLSELTGSRGRELDPSERTFQQVAKILGCEVAALEELYAKHRTIGIVVARDEKSWATVLRKPNRSEYKLFRANCNNAAQVSAAQETLYKAISIVPDGIGAIESLLTKWPGIPEACAEAGTFQRLSGMAGTEQGKS
jgi:preprotein translocase subunit Sss1